MFRFALRSYMYLMVHAVPAWIYSKAGVYKVPPPLHLLNWGKYSSVSGWGKEIEGNLVIGSNREKNV